LPYCFFLPPSYLKRLACAPHLLALFGVFHTRRCRILGAGAHRGSDPRRCSFLAPTWSFFFPPAVSDCFLFAGNLPPVLQRPRPAKFEGTVRITTPARMSFVRRILRRLFDLGAPSSEKAREALPFRLPKNFLLPSPPSFVGTLFLLPDIALPSGRKFALQDWIIYIDDDLTPMPLPPFLSASWKCSSPSEEKNGGLGKCCRTPPPYTPR